MAPHQSSHERAATPATGPNRAISDGEARALMRLASVGAALRLLAELRPSDPEQADGVGLVLELLAGYCKGGV